MMANGDPVDLCSRLIKFYNCLLDLVNEDCLIDRVFVTYFNEIEIKLREANCQLNPIDKNRKFFYYFKTRLYSTELLGGLVDDDDDENDSGDGIDPEPPDDDDNDDSNNKSSYPATECLNEPRSSLPDDNNNDGTYSLQQRTQTTAPGCVFSVFKRCNYYRYTNRAYVLSTESRMFRKLDYLAQRSHQQAIESIVFVNNLFFSLRMEYNYKLDFKVGCFFLFLFNS